VGGVGGEGEWTCRLLLHELRRVREGGELTSGNASGGVGANLGRCQKKEGRRRSFAMQAICREISVRVRGSIILACEDLEQK